MSRERSSGKRLKLLHILTIIVASALALLAWTQTWVVVTLSTQAGSDLLLNVDGSVAAPALTALALAGLALAGALTIAGTIIRIILGFLEALLGFSVGLAVFEAVTDPAAASSAAVTAATGIAGHESVVAGVSSADLTFWPYLALVAAALMLVTGVSVIITVGRWPGPTTRYQAVRLEPVPATPDAPRAAATAADADAETAAAVDAVDHPSGHDSVGDWDDLSRGEDPTR
ncbi:Trp biosynthesis-associated membrane protein [Glaciibacter psychrotolerans]|uniref:Putative membrane protein (TIGR02234 family) n=1 Tax=Glaciibacter psychrotolerans TaxID=670054 RepID=A0A7Z0EDU9_9MICO|nr:Trp biosynthesis-associated membrane protein [Leifsonia psychrotolerans]NYJ19124.1 putative membrane protein (TIGR02234 family) [Leifsonia psychrotolerans]